MKQKYFREAPLIIQDFLGYMGNVKGRSELSVDEYYRDLRTFFRFIIKERGIVPANTEMDDIDISCVDLDMIKTVTFTDILLFLNYCQNDRKNSSTTRARKTSSLKNFFRYLTVKVNKLSYNPTEALDSPKKPKSMPKYLTLEDSLKLLKAVDGEFKERDYCILIFFLNCGMRISELVGINLSDINSENMLRIRGKGKKERMLYLNEACVDALQNYLKVRPVDGIDDKDALFISRKNCRMTPKAVQYMLDKYLKKIGLAGQGYSPHKLRHTAATLMYQKGGVDIRTLQAILGHSNLGTTQIYTHIADEQVIEGLKANPLGKKLNRAEK
ncbi:MAG: tyrosine recombinase XerC [Clostridia bacterium]|nr:tyrosine recombinase XerC [Clostridia bacterium]